MTTSLRPLRQQRLTGTLRPLRMQRVTCILRPLRLQGQAIVEYALLLGIVMAAIVGMQVYTKRGIQAGIKAVADFISPFHGDAPTGGGQAQRAGARYEAGERQSRAVTAVGTVLARESATTTTIGTSQAPKTITIRQTAGGGQVRTISTDTTVTRGAVTRPDLPDLPAGTSSYSEVVASDAQP